MIVFREDLYGMDVLVKGKYRTKRNRGLERCVLVRYMINSGYSKEEIFSSLKKLSYNENPYLSKESKEKIYNKIYEKALQYEYIKDKEVVIYKDEMEKILSVENQDARNLLFTSLVYYKWGQTIRYYEFYSKVEGRSTVRCKDRDILAISNIKTRGKENKVRLFNQLIKEGLYKTVSFKNTEYFYIPFAQNYGDIAFTIDNFDDLILWLYSYIHPSKYKKCEECGIWIRKTTGSKKYCSSCSQYVAHRKSWESTDLWKSA